MSWFIIWSPFGVLAVLLWAYSKPENETPFLETVVLSFLAFFIGPFIVLSLMFDTQFVDWANGRGETKAQQKQRIIKEKTFSIELKERQEKAVRLFAHAILNAKKYGYYYEPSTDWFVKKNEKPKTVSEMAEDQK